MRSSFIWAAFVVIAARSIWLTIITVRFSMDGFRHKVMRLKAFNYFLVDLAFDKPFDILQLFNFIGADQ